MSNIPAGIFPPFCEKSVIMMYFSSAPPVRNSRLRVLPADGGFLPSGAQHSRPGAPGRPWRKNLLFGGNPRPEPPGSGRSGGRRGRFPGLRTARFFFSAGPLRAVQQRCISACRCIFMLCAAAGFSGPSRRAPPRRLFFPGLRIARKILRHLFDRGGIGHGRHSGDFFELLGKTRQRAV